MITLNSSDLTSAVRLIDTISDAYSNNKAILIPSDLIKDFVKIFDKNLEIPGYLNIINNEHQF